MRPWNSQQKAIESSRRTAAWIDKTGPGKILNEARLWTIAFLVILGMLVALSVAVNVVQEIQQKHSSHTSTTSQPGT